MAVINPQNVPGVYNQWNVNANDYTIDVVSATGAIETKSVDFQDLLTTVNLKRASSVEREVSVLSIKIKKRNNVLEKLGALISDLGKAGAQFTSDSGNSSVTVDGWSADALDGLKAISDSWYIQDGKVIVTIGTYHGSWAISGQDSIKKSTYEMVSQLAKSRIDSLNNAAQMDMTKLQSLINKRDESYTTATTLMTNVADTRTNLIKNL